MGTHQYQSHTHNIPSKNPKIESSNTQQNPQNKLPSSSHSTQPQHAIFSLLQHAVAARRHSTKKPSKTSPAGGLFRMFKLLPMLSTGCKMVALLSGGGNRHRKPLLSDKATAGTLFGYRKGRLNLAIQEDPYCPPIFVIELPIQTAALYKEMEADVLRIALETDTKTPKKKLLEEFVWALYCNGRKVGYAIRRINMSDEEARVMQALRGVSMGAGVLPTPEKEVTSPDGELTYIRARFDRVVGSRDSESFYMFNPDGASSGHQELSIFFLRVH